MASLNDYAETRKAEKIGAVNEINSPTSTSSTVDHVRDEKLQLGARIGGGSGVGDIHGYHPELMSARTDLSCEDEKKLLRRVDWHLLPLMAIIYCVKTIDASNV